MNKIEELTIAKENVLWLLNNPSGNVDFHGLSFWAKKVEELREKIIAEL